MYNTRTFQNPQMTKRHGIISLNKAQEDAAHAPAGPLLIVAGAGTGKTRTLTSRILYLIEKGMPPSKICAITFTNKAANEMASRLALGTQNHILARSIRSGQKY